MKNKLRIITNWENYVSLPRQTQYQDIILEINFRYPVDLLFADATLLPIIFNHKGGYACVHSDHKLWAFSSWHYIC